MFFYDFFSFARSSCIAEISLSVGSTKGRTSCSYGTSVAMSNCNNATETQCNKVGQGLVNGKCQDCNPGTYNNSSTSNQCSMCPYGKYCEGGSKISNCPAGYGNKIGAKSKDECVKCSDGYISSEGGMCTPCEKGKKSNASRTSCYTPTSNPSSSDKCYKDTNNDYQVAIRKNNNTIIYI